jgi:hypothetical protein
VVSVNRLGRGLKRPTRQALREQPRVAARVTDVADGAGDPLLDGRERRLEPRDLAGVQDLLALSVVCQERHLANARLQLVRVAVDVQGAPGHGVVLDPFGADQVRHHRLAVLAEAELDDRVPPGPGGGALAEEPKAPGEERGIEPRTHADRRLLAEKRPKEHRGGLGRGPREGVARRDDAGIARARVLPDTVPLLEERDLVPILRQVIRGRDSGDAAPQD